VVGILQIVRIFILPMRAHSAQTVVNNQQVLVMHDGQFMRVCIYLALSAACLLAAAVINLKKCNELSEHMKAIGVQN
jgi:hypothetical protein